MPAGVRTRAGGPYRAGMSVQGSFRVGPQLGRLTLRTHRAGLAAQAGHDLTIELTRWEGDVVVGEDPATSSIDVTADTGSIRVVAGTGGVKPLSDRDKQEIARTARQVLDSDRAPEARFVSSGVSVDGSGGAVVDGTLTLLGTPHPFRLDVTDLGAGRYRGTGTVVQSEYGIKPYTAFFGALKVADRVEVEAELDLSR